MESKDKIFAGLTAKALGIKVQQAENVIKLLNDGCTIPFISRYRKEMTGNLDEVKVAEISNGLGKCVSSKMMDTPEAVTVKDALNTPKILFSPKQAMRNAANSVELSIDHSCVTPAGKGDTTSGGEDTRLSGGDSEL